MIKDRLKDNTIIVTNYNYKISVLKELNENSDLFNIKFFEMRDLMNKVYFSYDENAIYYLMDKYNLKHDIANIYLKNMYFIEDKVYKNKKLNDLLKLKRDLLDKKMFFVDNLFFDYIKDKNIVFYGYNYFSKEEEKLIKLLDKYCNVEIISKEYKTYNHDVLSFPNIYDEIEYIAVEISKLIESGVSIDKIKITNLDDDYYDITKDIFKLFNLDIINPCKMISSKVCYSFLNMEGTIEEKIETLKKQYKNNEVLEELINIVNKYIVFDNLDIVDQMIKEELKSTTVPNKVYNNTIEVIDYLNYPTGDNYIFMLNFNQNSIPKLFKDEDYITDNMKDEIELDTTLDKNKKMRDSVIKNILNIKNLVITYKNSTPFKTYLPSDLISDLDFEVKNGKVSFLDSYSDSYNRIKLSKKLDNYIKTGLIEDNTNYLYSNYSDIEFSSYDNKYKIINKKTFHNYINNHFDLAYSSVDNYYKCPFRYYLANVLKLDIYEERFETYLGSLFHYVLEKYLENKTDIHELIYGFINDNEKELSKKEEFFINKIEKDIKYVAEVILEQLDNTDLKEMLFENRIAIDKKYGDITVTFKGFIDKIMYKEEDCQTIVAIIDYKTGSADIKLDYVPFGLYMQLPVYLYLAKNSNKLKDVSFAGFYLQRVLNSEVNVSNKKSYDNLKRDNVLLYGYSNSDEEILHKFDYTYKNSKFIKSMKLNNDGNFYGYANVLNNDEINKLINVVDVKINDAIQNISEGVFDIKPKRNAKEVLGCKYCKFRDICFKENEDEELIIPDKNLSFLGGDINA